MRPSKLAALMLAAAVAGSAGLALAPTPSAAQADARQFQRSPGQHVEGRIAYLKAELRVTDAQAPLWNKLADVMRQNAKAMDDAFSAVRRDPNAAPSALASLEARARLTEVRAQATQHFVAAFRPLYDAMSDDQKKSADELLSRQHWR